MKKLSLLCVILASVFATSCYEEFTNDYEYSTAYFASQTPLRTIIADTDMTMKFGVAVGGKREVDTSDWATFSVDETLLDGTSFVLMPSNYYEFANDSYKMTITNPDLAICDIEVTFTEAFYNDPLAATQYYAIPLRLVDHNQDQVATDTNGNPRDYSIIAVKYQSEYHGTYYLRGELTNNDTQEVTTYSNKDLSANVTRDLSTVSRYVVQRPGYANLTQGDDAITLTIAADGSSVAAAAAGTDTPLTSITATLDKEAESLEFVGAQPEFELEYSYTKSGVSYTVKETLTRRQSPADDLRFEEW